MRHPAINKGKAPVAGCCCIALRLLDEAGAVEPSTVEQLKLQCLAFVFGKQPSIESKRAESFLQVCIVKQQGGHSPFRMYCWQTLVVVLLAAMDICRF